MISRRKEPGTKSPEQRRVQDYKGIAGGRASEVRPSGLREQGEQGLRGNNSWGLRAGVTRNGDRQETQEWETFWNWGVEKR